MAKNKLPQWKDWESSYQLRQILGHFLSLNFSNFRLKQCEDPLSYQKC